MVLYISALPTMANILSDWTFVLKGYVEKRSSRISFTVIYRVTNTFVDFLHLNWQAIAVSST